MHEACGKRIPGSNRVRDPHRKSFVLVALIAAHQKAASAAACNADQFHGVLCKQALCGRTFAGVRQAAQLHNSWKFLVIQLDYFCHVHRLSENFRGIKVLPQIDVENLHRVRAYGMKEMLNCVTTLLGSLSQGTETNCVAIERQLLPGRSPLKKIPGDGLEDL